ncbi:MULTISPECIES: hypothetical protein [Streptomyces]|uniref:Regulatory protein n=1 Tax=Streptomyces sviceus (strain ATCC 29083 / DSM 924 / JCM 4929 / NBRC 13980 / NCIMB 11184 / NRRL 5439 / UC 5370) TaxID=463191 RepID=B5HSC2_STRX2|nr:MULTISPECIES: hypothetical protein [Streptomyces]EDY55727.1 conserved hypothetical protein [Streptomyces sviceus ATCC 29083]MYT10801.1 hypothetical protein [Streptomyces sp. SID5470]
MKGGFMPEPVSLRAKYTAMMTAELELIAKERERIELEVAALQDQLRLLERDQAWLSSRQEQLPPFPVAEGGNGDAAVLAGPVQDGASRGGVGEQPVGPAGMEPTLRNLVVGELQRHGVPRSSNDVAAVLRRAHPKRRIKEPAMRHVLEALVKQGRVQRAKRGSRVFYFVADAAPQGQSGR